MYALTAGTDGATLHRRACQTKDVLAILKSEKTYINL